MNTHTFRDVGENGGYVKLVGKLKSGSFGACGDAAPDTASSWRNEMNKRNNVVCMLNHEYVPSKKSPDEKC